MVTSRNRVCMGETRVGRYSRVERAERRRGDRGGRDWTAGQENGQGLREMAPDRNPRQGGGVSLGSYSF